MGTLNKLIIFQVLQNSLEWAGEAHDMIGRIALNNLPSSSSGFICALLDKRCPLEDHINGLGRWADNPEPELLWTRKLHYANIPFHTCGSFYFKRDCAKDCVVSALRRYITVSMDESASKEDRKIALKLVIHLVGDIHNPVHLGYLEDHGGNKIPVAGFGHHDIPVVLHNVWDFHIPIRFKNTPFVQNIKPPQRDDKLDAFTSRFPAKFVDYDTLQASLTQLLIDIASESTALVCQAYRHMAGDETGKGPWIQPGDTLLPMYINRMSLVAQDRIRKAGVRLAKILDFIATHQLTKSAEGGEYKSPFPPKAPQSVSTQQGIQSVDSGGKQSPKAPQSVSTEQGGPDDTKAVKDNLTFPLIIFFITICMI